MHSCVISSFWCWNGLGNKFIWSIFFGNCEYKHIWLKCLLCATLCLSWRYSSRKGREVLASSELKPQGFGCFQPFPPFLTSCPLPGDSSVPPTQTERPFPFIGDEAGHVACSGPVVCEQMLPAGVWKAGLLFVFSLCVRSASLGRCCPFTLEFTHAPPPVALRTYHMIAASSQPKKPEKLYLCFQSHWVWGCTEYFDNS